MGNTLEARKLMKHPLQDARREAFCQYKAQGMNGTEAALAAGYRGHSARVTASQLLDDPSINARIAALMAPSVRRTVQSIEELMQLFVEQATFDPAVFKDVNTVEDLCEKVPEELRRALVEGWEYDKQGRLKLKLVSKEAALDRIARHLSFYNDRLVVAVVGAADLLEAAERRMKHVGSSD